MVKSQKQFLSKETLNILGGGNKGNKKKKKKECLKRQNSKICKISMGGNDTHKNQYSKLKQNAKKQQKNKKLMLKKTHNFIKEMQKMKIAN